MKTNNKTIKIKPAGKEDLEKCYSLIQELALFEEEDLNNIISKADFFKYAEEDEAPFRALLAFDENEAVGMALYYYRYSSWRGKHVHMEDLFVKESHRGYKIGDQLLEGIIALAKEEGLKRIEWEVHDVNEKAINFYKKKGADVSDEWKICRIEL